MASGASSPSMDQLATLDRIHVKQRMTILSGNEYALCSQSGEVLFRAKEETTGLILFKAKKRPFHMDIFDAQGRQVVALRRPYTFFQNKMDVKVYGTLVSVVRTEMTFMTPVLYINDADNRQLLKVKGPMITSGEADFQIFTSKKTHVGCIRKKWSGFMKESFTSSDNFVITFQKDLDVHVKAAIIGTCFLIDFLYYER